LFAPTGAHPEEQGLKQTAVRQPMGRKDQLRMQLYTVM